MKQRRRIEADARRLHFAKHTQCPNDPDSVRQNDVHRMQCSEVTGIPLRQMKRCRINEGHKEALPALLELLLDRRDVSVECLKHVDWKVKKHGPVLALAHDVTPPKSVASQAHER
jgi:hypothetical protein